MRAARQHIKRILASVATSRASSGVTVLVYHRIGGSTADEQDVALESFVAQMDLLASLCCVVSLDHALDELESGSNEARVVITFDDGFSDVATTALSVLRERQLPFATYLTTRYIGGRMRWEGSTSSEVGSALTWDEIGTLVGSGLCTLGNHTHDHVPPSKLDDEQLDLCSAAIEQHVGTAPKHFAYPWGIDVPAMEPALRARFRSAATGKVGRNHSGDDPLRLRRVPVRGSDPIEFFAAKLMGRLVPERAYGAIVKVAKLAGFNA